MSHSAVKSVARGASTFGLGLVSISGDKLAIAKEEEKIVRSSEESCIMLVREDA